jgi:hypothetical protein
MMLDGVPNVPSVFLKALGVCDLQDVEKAVSGHLPSPRFSFNVSVWRPQASGVNGSPKPLGIPGPLQRTLERVGLDPA